MSKIEDNFSDNIYNKTHSKHARFSELFDVAQDTDTNVIDDSIYQEPAVKQSTPAPVLPPTVKATKKKATKKTGALLTIKKLIMDAYNSILSFYRNNKMLAIMVLVIGILILYYFYNNRGSGMSLDDILPSTDSLARLLADPPAPVPVPQAAILPDVGAQVRSSAPVPRLTPLT